MGMVNFVPNKELGISAENSKLQKFPKLGEMA